MAARRRIKKAIIGFISLCPRGANGLTTIYKSDDTFLMELLCKDFNTEKGELLAVVAAPELVDSQGDVMGEEAIRDAMYQFAKSGFDIDIKHNSNAVARSDAFVAESFVIQKGDARFADQKTYDGKTVDVSGGWGVVIKIENPDLRAKYGKDGWNGVSMGGLGLVETLKEDNKPNKGDLDMDPKDLAKAISESVTAALAPLAKSIEALTAKPDDKKISSAPILKSANPTTKELRIHSVAVRKHAITSALDYSDPFAVNAATEGLEKLDDELAEINKSDATEDDGKSSEIKKLEARIADLRKSSNRGSGKGKPAKGDEGDEQLGRFDGIRKSDDDDDDTEDCLRAGKAMAAAASAR